MPAPIYIAFAPIYAHPLPAGHRFPMLKYELIPEQLCYEGVIRPAHLHTPLACAHDIILLTHTQEYLGKLVNQQLSAKEQRHIGFPQSPALTARELIITQGTINCCLHALQHGFALNIAGGTHHAFADRGEGFCLLNDFAVAAKYLLHQNLAKKILVIDLDVHQGNGTAHIFREESRVFTFSMHGHHNYPFLKEKSDLDIPLDDGTGDMQYLTLLKETLPRLIDSVQPDFAFYLSGVDVLATDAFGKLKLSRQACLERDQFVFDVLRVNKVPCTVAMGGGYSPDIDDIVTAHVNTFKAAIAAYEGV